MKDVYLDNVGHQAPDNVIHRNISALSTGDGLQLQQKWNHWVLIDNKGCVVGKFAKGVAPLADMRCCIAAHVAAIIVRKREDVGPEYKTPICARWEVVLPELVFGR